MCYREFPCQRDLIRLGLGLGLGRGLGLALGFGLILTWPPGEKATKGRSTPGSLLATPPHAAANVPAEANGASLVPMPGRVQTRVQSLFEPYTKRQTGWDSPISHSQRAAANATIYYVRHLMAYIVCV